MINTLQFSGHYKKYSGHSGTGQYKSGHRIRTAIICMMLTACFSDLLRKSMDNLNLELCENASKMPTTICASSSAKC